MTSDTLLAIDPDTKAGCACAYFDVASQRLNHVVFDSMPGTAFVTTVVVERMQADGRTRDIDVRDLLECQFVGALAAGYALGLTMRTAELVHYTPTEWKGSIPKPVHHDRLWKILSEHERAVLGGAETKAQIDRAVEKGALSRWSKPGAAYYPRSFVTHNLLDAVALGCFHLGRIGK